MSPDLTPCPMVRHTSQVLELAQESPILHKTHTKLANSSTCLKHLKVLISLRSAHWHAICICIGMKFTELKKKHKALTSIAFIPNEIPKNDYFAESEKFKESLRDFMKQDQNWALTLTKPQLLEFLSWCSIFRPREPHQILTSISIQLDRLNDLKKESSNE